MVTVNERRYERRDTAANWSSSNPVLAVGEPGYDITNKIVKFGDGATAWNSLAGFSAVSADSTSLTLAAGVMSRNALTGDITAPAGSSATTLKNTGPGATGPIGSGTSVPVLTIDAQGRATALTSAATVGTVAATDSSIVVTGTTAPTIQRAALTGDIAASAGSNATTLAASISGAHTFTGAFATTSTNKPKDIEGFVYVDPANSQGWSGSDAGAWINSAFSYIHTTYTDTNGGVIQLAPGSYSFSTPIVLANAGLMSIILRGAGDGNGATILNYTATSGSCISIGGGSGNDGGVQLEDFTITGTALGNGATAIQIGVVGTAGVAGSTLKNVSIRRFTNGINWATTSIAYAVVLLNCKVQQCTNGIVPFGENNVMTGGLVGGNTNGIVCANAAEMQLFGVAFDDNTTTAINMSHNLARFSLLGCRFENAGLGTSNYITQSNGAITMYGGAFQEDNTSGGPATGFLQGTGGVANFQGVWLYSGGRVVTQVFNCTSPQALNYGNMQVAPGASSPSTTLAQMTPAAYQANIVASSSALTAADTLIKSIPIPLNTLEIGKTYRIRWTCQYAATVTNAANFRARLGTANSIADALLCTVTTLAGGTAAVGASGEIMVTIRTLGATAAVMANGHNLGIPAAGVAVSNQTATVAVASGSTNFLSLTAGVAATTSNLTFTQCSIEPVELNSN